MDVVSGDVSMLWEFHFLILLCGAWLVNDGLSHDWCCIWRRVHIIRVSFSFLYYCWGPGLSMTVYNTIDVVSGDVSMLWEFHFPYHIILFGAWLVNDGLSHDWCCIWRSVHTMRVSFSLSYCIVRGLACQWRSITRLMLYLEMCPYYESFIDLYHVILFGVWLVNDGLSHDWCCIWRCVHTMSFIFFIILFGAWLVNDGLSHDWCCIWRCVHTIRVSLTFIILYCSGPGLSMTVYHTIDVVSGDVSILWEFHFLYHIILFGAWLVNDGISHDWCCIWRCVHTMRVSFSLSYYIVRGLACQWRSITRLMLYLEMCPCYESFIFFIILYCSGPGLSMTVYHAIDVVSGDVSILWEFHWPLSYYIVRGVACQWRSITRLMLYLEMCPCYESFIFFIILYCSGCGLSMTVYHTIDVVSGDVSILWEFHWPLSYYIVRGLACQWRSITRLMLYLEMCPCYESFIFFIILYCSGPGLSMTVYHAIDVVSGDVSTLWEFHWPLSYYIVRGLACQWRSITRLMLYLEMCPYYERFIDLYHIILFGAWLVNDGLSRDWCCIWRCVHTMSVSLTFIILYCSGPGLSMTAYHTMYQLTTKISSICVLIVNQLTLEQSLRLECNVLTCFYRSFDLLLQALITHSGLEIHFFGGSKLLLPSWKPGSKTNFVVAKLYVHFYAAVVLGCVDDRITNITQKCIKLTIP